MNWVCYCVPCVLTQEIIAKKAEVFCSKACYFMEKYKVPIGISADVQLYLIMLRLYEFNIECFFDRVYSIPRFCLSLYLRANLSGLLEKVIVSTF